jgi:hypothetical protein
MMRAHPDPRDSFHDELGRYHSFGLTYVCG